MAPPCEAACREWLDRLAEGLSTLCKRLQARWLQEQHGTAEAWAAVRTATWLTRLRGASDRTGSAREWLVTNSRTAGHQPGVAEGVAQRVTQSQAAREVV